MRPKILFLGITLISILLIFGVCALFYRFLFSFDALEHKEYWELMAKADPKKSEATAIPYTATQQHRQAHKDFWFMKNGQRLQLRLRSADTELVLDHHDEQTEVLEHMRDVKCFLQEELYYVLPDGSEAIQQPDGQITLRHHEKNQILTQISDISQLKPMQIIRYMEADTATYYYQTDHFIAEHVKVSRFAAPGHALLESINGLKPMMSGIAQSVEFSLVGKDLNFTAYQLKATLHSTGRSL
jgi:hypothetical protein